MNKEVRQLLREMVEKGWQWKQRKNHFQLTHPSGKSTIISSTPSDGRALKNARADIKRIERYHHGSSPTA